MSKSSLKHRNGSSTSLAKIAQAANQTRELPKRNVTDALMGLASSPTAPTQRNPSGSPATKKTRGDETTPPGTSPMLIDPVINPSSPPRNQRSTVGFSETRTEITDLVQDDGRTYASVTQRMVPVFTASNTRSHTYFMRVKLPVPDHRDNHNSDATKESRELLKRFMETMIQIDPTAIVYKWRPSSPEEKDA
jgi:hypothetical protein